MTMKATNPGPVPCEKESESPRTRLQKLKKAFHNLKKKLTGENKKTKVRSNGLLRGQWRQEDLPKIVKKIVDKHPGITDIQIYGTEIHWHCEINYYDLFPKKKENQNPSKERRKNN